MYKFNVETTSTKPMRRLSGAASVTGLR